jgi:hypothetical protein
VVADEQNGQDQIVGIAWPLDKMTTSEKLRVMERLGDDLCRNPGEAPSSPWHGAVLAERERRVAEGKISVIDLDEAKERIRKATR